MLHSFFTFTAGLLLVVLARELLGLNAPTGLVFVVGALGAFFLVPLFIFAIYQDIRTLRG